MHSNTQSTMLQQNCTHALPQPDSCSNPQLHRHSTLSSLFINALPTSPTLTHDNMILLSLCILMCTSLMACVQYTQQADAKHRYSTSAYIHISFCCTPHHPRCHMLPATVPALQLTVVVDDVHGGAGGHRQLSTQGLGLLAHGSSVRAAKFSTVFARVQQPHLDLQQDTTRDAKKVMVSNFHGAQGQQECCACCSAPHPAAANQHARP
ncbi:hypothetical protein COO60DRAFT_1230335 [Scenedesmus sp. NREL 46B-D3]|nr:hypothetical protein COO60DRAFT_1230335 [Scenedesmus sp. NREL 46B-D3]